MRNTAIVAAAFVVAVSACGTPTSAPIVASDSEPAPAEPVSVLSKGWESVEHASSHPHTQRITSVAVAPGGDAAATIDGGLRVRLWPSLSKGLEPIDPGLETVAKVALARVGDDVVAASIDTARLIQIIRVTDGVTKRIYSEPDQSLDAVVLAKTGNTVILRTDQSLDLRDLDGELVARYDKRGFRPSKLFATGPATLAAIEVDKQAKQVELKLTMFAVESKTAAAPAALTPVGKSRTLVVPGNVTDLSASAFGPAGKRFGVTMSDPETGNLSVLVFDLEDESQVVTTDMGPLVASGPLSLGFADANNLVLALPSNLGTFSINAKTGVSRPLALWTNSSNLPRLVSHGVVVSVVGAGLHVYDVPKRQARFLTYKYFFPTHGITSPSGDFRFYMSNTELYLHETKVNKLFSQQSPDRASLNAAFFLDDETLIFITYSGAIKMVDVRTGEQVASATGGGSVMASVFDPKTKRLIVVPRWSEVWIYDVADRNLGPPWIVSDGAARAGFLDGDHFMWTLDNSNVLRTYTLDEVKAGVSRKSGYARGKRIGNVHPLTISPTGDAIFNFYDGKQRLGIKKLGEASEFGAASIVEGELPAAPKRLLNVDTKAAKFPTTSQASSLVSLSPDGRRLAIIAPMSLTVLSVPALKQQWSFPVRQQLGSVAWSADSRRLSAQGGTGVGFFDARNGNVEHLSCGPVFAVSPEAPVLILDPGSGSLCAADH